MDRTRTLLTAAELAYLVEGGRDALGNPASVLVHHPLPALPPGVSPGPDEAARWQREQARMVRALKSRVAYHARQHGLIGRTTRVLPDVTRVWMEVPGERTRERRGPHWLRSLPSKRLTKRDALRIYLTHGEDVFETVFGVRWPGGDLKGELQDFS